MKLSAGMQKKLWSIKPASEKARRLSSEMGVSPLVAQVLVNRGIDRPEEARVFLAPKLNELIPPEDMPGIKPAVERIALAIKNNEKITIYGDYDVDGITSVAILSQLLKMLDAEVDFYIPHRIDEGYGLNEQAINQIAQSGTKLIITVDCGITANKSVKMVKELGLGLVITDHHQPAKKLPRADAIVHPLLDENYKNPHSCGAMVAFKLAWALANEFSEGNRLQGDLRQFMINATSLAAMGTVADVVSLTGENRIITSFGLKSIPHSDMSGIKALVETANLTGRGLDSFHIGFRLAPLLNAAGRMGHARLAVELLTSDNDIRSMQIAEYLKSQNSLRQKCQKDIFKQAREMISRQNLNHPDRKTIVLADENWHTGVIGIVASKVVDKYFRPSIMINVENGKAQGSARSIPGFDILKAIEQCSKYLESYGGHKMAAGVTMKSENVDKFVNAFEEYAKTNMQRQDSIEKLEIDGKAKLSNLDMKTVDQLTRLEPFGQGNPKPIFATSAVKLAMPPRKVGAKGDHLQLAVTDDSASVRCIGFGMGKYEKKLLEADFFSVAYEPQINEYNGNSNVQLQLIDIQFDQVK